MRQTQQSLKDAMRGMYEDIYLSDNELQKIRQQSERTVKLATRDPVPTTFNHKYKHFLNQFVAVAACLVISVIGFTIFWHNNQQAHRIDNIITDVIDNHLSHKDLYYQASTIAELANQFSYLGFMLSEANQIISTISGDLIGGRPCLILSNPAAQLRYRIDDHRWTTVFQLHYDKAIYGAIPDTQTHQKPLIRVLRGIKVSLWQENGLLFAAAEPSL